MTDFDIPLFRHSVDDVPNDDWTVEEVFQWTLLRSYKIIDDRIDSMADNLRSQLAQGGKELEGIRKEVPQKQTANAENRPNHAYNDTTTTTKPAMAILNRTGRSTATVQAKVADSEHYMGKIFTLEVTKKKACHVGRSGSKKFKVNGISLAKDLEVSTTHGKFELHNDGNVYYVDTGSTNGSKLDGTSLEADVPYLIETGSKLLLGATEFEFTVV